MSSCQQHFILLCNISCILNVCTSCCLYYYLTMCITQTADINYVIMLEIYVAFSYSESSWLKNIDANKFHYS